MKFLSKEVEETQDCIDLANKVSSSTYIKKRKIFGITWFTYTYKLESTITDPTYNPDQPNKVGFYLDKK